MKPWIQPEPTARPSLAADRSRRRLVSEHTSTPRRPGRITPANRTSRTTCRRRRTHPVRSAGADACAGFVGFDERR